VSRVLTAEQRERKRVTNRKHYEAHREGYATSSRAYAAAHPERIRATCRKYRATHSERERARHHAYKMAHPEAAILDAARTRGKRYGVPCTLTLADVRELLAPMRCSATGLPLAHATGKASALSPSLDRIVPALGYVPGNVRLVCHRFNMLRGADPVSQDYRHALRVLAETSNTTDRAVHQ